MALTLEAVAFDVPDAPVVAAFWAALLEREAVEEPGAVLVPGDSTQVGLRFVAADEPPEGRPRLHLHLTSATLEDKQAVVERVRDLGGRHLDVGQGDAEFVVLADPAGGELCVIEPGNRFLAGTGFLGEVTCAGGPAVGRFWGAALGWPLVWEEGDQTAVQSPRGGTKLSWDVWPPDAEPRMPATRQRFDLLASDPAEVDRLVALGATVLDRTDVVRLADPEGDVFVLRPSAE